MVVGAEPRLAAFGVSFRGLDGHPHVVKARSVDGDWQDVLFRAGLDSGGRHRRGRIRRSLTVGLLVVDALAERRPGMLVAWTPSVEEGARFLGGLVRPGDRVVTIGAGDVDRAAGALLETLG